MTAATASNILKSNGRIVIVGASLAGLRGAEALRDEGFNGQLTIIGDGKDEPYDRPPLSKQVLKGWVKADQTKLPRMREVDADWRLGLAATGLDRMTKQVLLGDGSDVYYDRLLIATGVRSRQCARPDRSRATGRLHAPDQRRRGADRASTPLAAQPKRVQTSNPAASGALVRYVPRSSSSAPMVRSTQKNCTWSSSGALFRMADIGAPHH